ncbi:hypothetical protein BcepSauron_320 [Burkholderia phage BcepSauron]|uniref:Uncharacterized protein n=1 Tax=Burkholderia phage BcepSauron TaxID=2530033 RepID=A0A482MNL1_9CAUD|nr:hypothetical protein H1O17_gp320 [Burkholderia phage BcepSauron]QBQ74700.1 hypothetical protein BcepSauron_320 [Burkholderia phage BcepSauron]
MSDFWNAGPGPGHEADTIKKLRQLGIDPRFWENASLTFEGALDRFWRSADDWRGV